MASSILFNPRKAVYRPGDEVKGFVQFCGQNMDEVACVQITFLGQLKSKASSSAQMIVLPMVVSSTILLPLLVSPIVFPTERDRVLLFKRDTLTLYRDRSTVQSSTRMWEFSFRFPVSIVPRRVERWETGVVTKTFREQALPPSCRIETSHGYCSVSYTLQATVKFHTGKPQHYFRSLKFVPTASANDMYPEWIRYKNRNYVAHGSDLLPRPAPSAVVLGREKIMSLWPKTKLPTLRLEMRPFFPAYLCVGEPFRIRIHVIVQEPHDRDIPLPSVPELYLEKAAVSIERKTNVMTGLNSFSRNKYLFARTIAGPRTILPGSNIVEFDQKWLLLSPPIRLSSIRQEDSIYMMFVVTTTGGRHKRRFKLEASIDIQRQAASNTFMPRVTKALAT
ncbi:hypothetical protein DIS24_g10662 [Lasiodiplodia hormozganensis]|uniref:Arrestin-like N-terminal domain-containing protein n=1 Tax=Lasiodiplodia hormozganensis TaxID=869390 RepID=A0AA39XP35_9PEZI|nr:hypothetical protein DIS24_g10662 [Lasiodiplodia hormozganensis]